MEKIKEGKKFICKQCNYICSTIIEPNDEMVCPICEKLNKGYLYNINLDNLITPTEEEKEVASYSKYGFIQPFDHEELSILTLDVDGKISYKVNEVYKNFYNIFKQAYNINNNYTHMWMNKYNPAISLLYKIYTEEPENFSCLYYGLIELEDMEDLYDVYLCISDSLKDSYKSNSVTYKRLCLEIKKLTPLSTSTFLKFTDVATIIASRVGRQTGAKMNLNQMEDIAALSKIILPVAKPNNKTQSQEDRDAKLKAAEEKRVRKRLKRQNN